MRERVAPVARSVLAIAAKQDTLPNDLTGDELIGPAASRTSDRAPVASPRSICAGSSNARSAAPKRYHLASHNEHGPSQCLTLLGRKSNTRTPDTPAAFSHARC